MVPEISIVIPVYNASKYLRSCIESVLSQTFNNFQVISINDGSTDDSLLILEEFAAIDDRIMIISKENEGVSVARNVGLANAVGRYVYFMDADDLLYSDALTSLYLPYCDRETTLVKADYQTIGGSGNILYSNKKMFLRNRYSNNKLDFDTFSRKIIMGEYFLWTCLFRRDIIFNNNIQFIPGCRMMEDAAFIMDYSKFSPVNTYIHETIYGYRKVQSSATGTKNDYLKDLEDVYKHISDNFCNPKPKYIMSVLFMIDEYINNRKGIKLPLCKWHHKLENFIISIRYKFKF